MSLFYKFPRLYDRFVDRMLADPVIQHMTECVFYDMLAAETLPPGAVVMDLACGTGLIALCVAQKRPDVYVIGVDLAEDMLQRANRQAVEKKLDNVRFIRRDVLELPPTDLLAPFGLADVGEPPLHMVLCAHGFSAMDNGRAVFDKSLSLLKPEGAYLILDIYFPGRSWGIRFLNNVIVKWLFGADQFRQPWEFPEDAFEHFERRDGHSRFLGIEQIVYVAKGSIRKAHCSSL
jgi:ubiquinone/menaquinone biosynthesis C-methylase UbiE